MVFETPKYLQNSNNISWSSITFSGGLHTAAGAKHGAHHWYPDLEYHRQVYGEGPVSKVRKLILIVARCHIRSLKDDLTKFFIRLSD